MDPVSCDLCMTNSTKYEMRMHISTSDLVPLVKLDRSWIALDNRPVESALVPYLIWPMGVSPPRMLTKGGSWDCLGVDIAIIRML